QVAVGDGGGHGGNVADLAGQVTGHEVHVICEVLPGAGDTLHLRLSARQRFRSQLAGDTGHFRCERVELIDHRVDRVLQLENFPLHVDGDLLRQVAVGDGGRHGGNVTHLGGEVTGHEVHVVGKVLPRAGHALYLGL